MSSPASTDRPAGSILRRALDRFDRLSSGPSPREARELQDQVVRAGCGAISSYGDRDVATLHGTLRSVTLRPRGGVSALEAELYDGTGTVTLIWLGRRRIAGVEPGRQLTVQGRLGCHDGVRMLYNPRYVLSP